MTKKILLVTLGSRGDVNPFICLGKHLKNKGHEVTLISSELYQGIAGSAGLNFISCSSASEYFEGIDNPDFYDVRKVFKPLTDYLSLRPMRGLYNIISKFEPSNTLLIASLPMVGARIANEKLGFPLVSINLQPAAFCSVAQPTFYPGTSLQMPYFLKKLIFGIVERWLLDGFLSPEINQFRQELNLPKISRIYSKWMFSSQKIIGLFPEWFAKPAIDWPAQTELTGFVYYDENANHPLPRSVINFLDAGSPPLILTYGTATKQCHKFYNVFIEAARRLKKRVLILTQHANQLPELNSNNEMHFPYLSLRKLLTHSSAIIHHGGIGTLAQSLAASIPQLIVPLAHDQFDNANRVEKLGIGLNLMLKEYSVNDAIKKIEELLTSDSVKSKCSLYSKKINFQQAEEQTIKIIESVND